MNFISKIHFIVLLSIFFFFFGCRKSEQYPIIPEIKFVSLDVYTNDSTHVNEGLLKFSYSDGDGDLGLQANDTTPPHDYDIYSLFYKKHNVNGVIDTIKINTPAPVAARIPYLTPKGATKAIKGEIDVTIPLPLSNGGKDTIYFQTYIFDRAMHKSNIITTPDFIL